MKNSMRPPKFWDNNSPLPFMLSPLSLLYYCGHKLNQITTRNKKLSIPVFSIGNATVGGTGKTPLALYLGRYLKSIGKNPHYLSRGYKGNYKQCTKVDLSQHNAEMVGDEALLLANVAPIWVCPDRRISAQKAIDDGADIIILDDGLQNQTLHKDFSILVVDGQYGFGNGFMLPAGPLREPIDEAYAKTDLILLMGELHNIPPFPKHIPVVKGKYVPQTEITKGPYVAFSGIGRPTKFYRTLRRIGAELCATMDFPDHHLFSDAELLALEEQATAQNAQLITTEKDWVRLNERWQKKITCLRVDLTLNNPDILKDTMNRFINNGKS
jgi:tetraacyldisaccharide 4'-kinase